MYVRMYKGYFARDCEPNTASKRVIIHQVKSRYLLKYLIEVREPQYFLTFIGRDRYDRTNIHHVIKNYSTLTCYGFSSKRHVFSFL